MELTNYNKDRKKRNKPAIDLSNMVYGKIPPQAKDLEEAILGALMLDKSAYEIISGILFREAFYVDAHQRIYNAIVILDGNNIPIDILTVVDQLKKSEELDLIGGPYYVTKLTNAVVGIGNIEAHARIILEMWMKRMAITVSGEIIGDAYEDSTNCFEVVEEGLIKLENVLQKVITGQIVDMVQSSFEFQNELDKKINSDGHITGITSGFKDIDNVTWGWQPSDLIILAARPAVGKTALALNLALKAAANEDISKRVAVGFFNMEMSRGQLMQRIVSAYSEIRMEQIVRGKLNAEEKNFINNKVMPQLSKIKLFIDDTPALNWLDFKSKARRLVAKHHVKIIFIDYLQLMSDVNDGERRNREAQISNISRNLKKTAKELNIPIVALSQLSRAVETRATLKNEPVLSDLRESGAIEQDADIVAFIYRPDGDYNNEKEVAGETIIKIAKHRNGITAKIKIVGKLHVQRFYEFGDPKLTATGQLIKKCGEYSTDDFTEGLEDSQYKF